MPGELGERFGEAMNLQTCTAEFTGDVVMATTSAGCTNLRQPMACIYSDAAVRFHHGGVFVLSSTVLRCAIR